MPKRSKRDLHSSHTENDIKPPELGNAAWDIIREIQEHGHWKRHDKMVCFRDGKMHNPGAVYFVKMQALSDLSRPENPTPYMVELVRIGPEIYLHLVNKPPQNILDAMAMDGTRNYTSTNDISSLLGNSDEPPKPAAKKTPPKKPRPSAKKPEPAVEQTPQQQQIAFAKKISAIALELVAARTKKQ